MEEALIAKELANLQDCLNNFQLIFLQMRVMALSDGKLDNLKTRAGLCADCRFKRLIQSDRGSTFLLCGRSATDPTFPKYPRLPVLQCRGYEQVDATNSTNDDAHSSDETA
jgi:hypothetical protein